MFFYRTVPYVLATTRQVLHLNANASGIADYYVVHTRNQMEMNVQINIMINSVELVFRARDAIRKKWSKVTHFYDGITRMWLVVTRYGRAEFIDIRKIVADADFGPIKRENRRKW